MDSQDQAVLKKDQTTRDLLARVERERANEAENAQSDTKLPPKKVLSFSNYMSNVEQRKQGLAGNDRKEKEEVEETPEGEEVAEKLGQVQQTEDTSSNPIQEEIEASEVPTVAEDNEHDDDADSPLSTISSELSAVPSSTLNERSSTFASVNVPPSIPEGEFTGSQSDHSSHSNFEDEGVNDDDSDAETVHAGSPMRPQRGRLVKKSDLENHDINHSTSLSRIVDFEDSDTDDKLQRNRVKNQSRSRSRSRTQQPRRRTGRDSSGRLKLQRVCDKGKFEEAKQLIEQGADINDQDYAGNSALHEAALKGYTDIVELLLQNGAKVDLQSGPDDLDTPLIDAAANGHTETVKMLLKFGADPRIENAHGQNALDSLEEDGEDTPMLASLLKEASLRLQLKDKEKSQHSMANSEIDYSSSDDDHVRSKSRQRVQRRTLHTRNDLPWVDFTTRNGREEVFSKASEGDVQFVGTYLENGGKPETEALALAAKFGHTDVVNLFLAFGSEVDAQNSKGLTPLMETVGRGHIETVRLLLQAGANPFKTAKDGKSAIDFAKDSLIVDEEEVTLLQTFSGVDSATSQSDISSRKRKISLKQDAESSAETKKKKVVLTEDTTQSLSKAQTKSVGVEREASKSKTVEHKYQSLTKPEAKRVTSSGNSIPVAQRKVSAPVLESEEEKSARVQKEKEEQKLREQYEEKRKAKLKAREQEFLNNFESKEKMKEEELKKISQIEEELALQEKKRYEERIKLEEERKILLSKKEETERRRIIRESYPYGLQQTTFDNNRTADDVKKYLPFLFATIDGVRYSVDLQVIMILGVEDFEIRYPQLYESKVLMDETTRCKVFHYLYPILGNLRQRSVTKQQEDFKEQMEKFLRLQISWLRYDEVLTVVSTDFAHLKDTMISRTLELDIDGLKLQSFAIPSPKTNVTTSSRALAVELGRKLPLTFRGRSSVLKALARNKNLW